MWQDDTVTFQTASTVNSNGALTVTWADTSNTVLCDVQGISSEIAFKKYGLLVKEPKQVFDLTNSALWIKGNQVKYDSDQYWVKDVQKWDKIGDSNHTFVILDKVMP